MQAYKIEVPENDNHYTGRVIKTVTGEEIREYSILDRQEINKLIQEKAFRLGYSWDKSGKNISHINEEFLFFCDSGVITYSDELYFEECEDPGISWQVFLELPEPRQIVSHEKSFDIVKGATEKIKYDNGVTEEIVNGIRIPVRRKPVIPNFPATPPLYFIDPLNISSSRKKRDQDDFRRELIRRLEATKNTPYSAIENLFNQKETEMKKIKVAKAIRDDDGKLINVEKVETYRGVTRTKAVFDYMKENKIEDPSDVVSIELTEDWKETEIE